MNDHKTIQESFLDQLYVRGYIDRENYAQAIIDFKLGEDDALETGIEEHCGQREAARETDSELDGQEDWDLDSSEIDREDAENSETDLSICLPV